MMTSGKQSRKPRRRRRAALIRWCGRAGVATIAGVVVLSGTAFAAPPANDDFSGAQALTAPGVYTGTARESTIELGEPSINGRGRHYSVWFRYRAGCSCRITVDTGGSRFDTLLAVYTGSSLADLQLVGESDDDSPTGRLGSAVRFQARKGTTYWLTIQSYSDNLPIPEDDSLPQPDKQGNYELTVSDGSVEGKGVELTVPDGQSVASVRAGGFKLVATARRKVPVRIELKVARRAVKRLGLRSTVLGSVKGTLDYDQTLRATIPLERAARAALRGRRTLKATARLTLQNKAPNRVLEVPVRLG